MNHDLVIIGHSPFGAQKDEFSSYWFSRMKYSYSMEGKSHS